MKEAWPTPKVDQASPPLRSAPLTGTCRAFPDLWRSEVNRAAGGVRVLQPHGPRAGDGDRNHVTPRRARVFKLSSRVWVVRHGPAKGCSAVTRDAHPADEEVKSRASL